jgi:hypothetical protein
VKPAAALAVAVLVGASLGVAALFAVSALRSDPPAPPPPAPAPLDENVVDLSIPDDDPLADELFRQRACVNPYFADSGSIDVLVNEPPGSPLLEELLAAAFSACSSTQAPTPPAP